MPEQSPTLRDMINAEHDRGTSWRELSSRAVDPVTKQTASPSIVRDIALGELDRMPRDYHLRAIAVALHVPYEKVRQAAIDQWVPAGDPEDERQFLLAEAERLKAIAEQAQARADEALARLGEQTGDSSAHPQSA